MTSATPKPRAGEYVPDLTSESPDYRDRAEKIGEIYDDIAYLIAERDLLRERERELVETLDMLATGMEQIAKAMPDAVAHMPGIKWMPEKARAILAKVRS